MVSIGDMPSVQRPVTMSPSVWSFLRSAFAAQPLEALRTILEEEGYPVPTVAGPENFFTAVIEAPGPFLLRLGILKQPELLRGAVLSIEIDPGLPVEYVAKGRTIDGLARGDAFLVVYRLLDDQEFVVSRDRFVKTIHEGGWEDFIENEQAGRDGRAT